MGRLTGIEPATLGTTIRCSNQLSYNRHPRLSVSEEKIELSSQQASPQTNRSSWTPALRLPLTILKRETIASDSLFLGENEKKIWLFLTFGGFVSILVQEHFIYTERTMSKLEVQKHPEKQEQSRELKALWRDIASEHLKRKKILIPSSIQKP